YDDNINISPDSSFSASTQRKIHICSQETCQSQMPAIPEVHNRQSLIRRIKVHGDLDIKHVSQSGSHVTVTAEIKVDLKCIGKHHHNTFHGCDPGGNVAVSPGHCLAQSIRNDHFFYKACGKHIDSVGHISGFHLPVFGIRKLRQHFVMKYDGTCHKLREKGYEQRIVKNIVFSRLSSVGVDHIGYLLECKETDS